MSEVVAGDLEIIGIRDPNQEKERVLLRAINATDLEWYLLINTTFNEAGSLDLLNDHVFWFPSSISVKKGEYIRVYSTRKGEYKKINTKYGDEPAVFHDFFWGLSAPIWDMNISNAVTVFQIKTWNSSGVR